MLCFLREDKLWLGFPGGIVVRDSPASAGDTGSVPGSGRHPGEGSGNPLQYSHVENPTDRGAWQAAVHRVENSHTQFITDTNFGFVTQ